MNTAWRFVPPEDPRAPPPEPAKKGADQGVTKVVVANPVAEHRARSPAPPKKEESGKSKDAGKKEDGSMWCRNCKRAGKPYRHDFRVCKNYEPGACWTCKNNGQSYMHDWKKCPSAMKAYDEAKARRKQWPRPSTPTRPTAE